MKPIMKPQGTRTVYYTRASGERVTYRYPSPKGDTVCRLSKEERASVAAYAATHLNEETASHFSVSARTVMRIKNEAKKPNMFKKPDTNKLSPAKNPRKRSAESTKDVRDAAEAAIRRRPLILERTTQ